MGAFNETTIALGRDAHAAYRTACEHARQENGHRDGYSEDIQTSRGFRLLGQTTLAKAEKAIDAAWDDENSSLGRLLNDSKWGTWACYEITGKDAAEFKRQRGRKGTRDKVYLFAGWAAC